MTTQFIAHAEAPRTFSDKKGATKAIKRDLAKHEESHGDKLFPTGTEVQQTADGRFGVVVFCDLPESEAREAVGSELTGYVIQAEGTNKPAPADKPKTKRRAGEVNVDPTLPLVQCRANSKQQKIVDLLARKQGADLDALRSVCVKRDGTPWDDNSIRSALYYDVRHKGYGVRTEWKDDAAVYFLVLPEGHDAPLPPKQPKS